jgi:Uma2 family endonuclease
VLAPEQIAPERFRPLHRTEYDRMVEMGLFGEDERIELLEGVLVAMSPQKSRPAEAIHRLNERLVPGLAGRARVRIQSPLALSELSEPEPDLAVVPLGDYAHAHPTRALLVIEVADASLSKDKKVKAGIYARAGVPEYWLINLVDDVVLVHRRPAKGRYSRVQVLRKNGLLRPMTITGVAMRVADVIP